MGSVNDKGTALHLIYLVRLTNQKQLFISTKWKLNDRHSLSAGSALFGRRCTHKNVALVLTLVNAVANTRNFNRGEFQ
ncbi:hypothetical protein ACTXT7_002348 [Hymenolepis weldensis]